MGEDPIIQKLIRQAADAAARIFQDEERSMTSFLNIPDARIILDAFRKLPDHVEGELTPYLKAKYLGMVADALPKYDVPRLVKEIREYQLSLMEKAEAAAAGTSCGEMKPDGDGEDADEGTSITSGDIRDAIRELDDYMDQELSMEEFCRKYKRHLRFDPVQRTPQWEEHIFEVETEVLERCGKPGFMGYCFGYWSTKAEVLERYGIHWKSPSQMNPGVRFD